MSYLIIGVDPGHTIGLAALDLTGKPLRTFHIQQGGFGAALAELETWGTPSLIASDVRPAPELVLKLASAFNAALFVPQRPWREDDKRAAAAQMLEQFGHVVQNVHERDALSAAVQAWRHHQNLLRLPSQTDLSLEETGILRHLLLQGVRQTAAHEMIRRLRLPAEKEEKKAASPPSRPSTPQESSRPRPGVSPTPPSLAYHDYERLLSELRKRISYLEAERESLLHRIRLLENGAAGTRMADWEHQKMAARIQTLESQLHSIYEGRKKKRGQKNALPARPARRSVSLPPRPGPSSRSAPLVPLSTHSPSSARSPAAVQPAGAEADLKKLNALRLSKMVEEYRRTRAAHDASR